MMQKFTKFFNLIKENKQTRILSIMTVALLFIFTIGYSLSMFTGGSNKKVANIKVNDLSFNMTTNSGESDDRILHLQAGKLEQFDIMLTNLNKVNVKYEIIYELCNNQDCTSTSKDIPKDLVVYKEKEDTNINGSLDINKNNSIRILTKNKSNNDYYIKLSLNVGYSWNELDLIGQIKDVISINQDIDIIAYVDGKEVNELPTTCFYIPTSKAYKNNAELADTSVSFNCDSTTNKWSYTVNNINNLPDKITVNFEKGLNAVTYLTKLYESDTSNVNGFYVDNTADKNLRYTGMNPKNLVYFNGDELWRIIGIFNIKDSTGAINKSIKLIRFSSLGKYSWDATGNNNLGINDWSEADLMKELNGDYLDTSLTVNKSNWYNSSQDSTTKQPVFSQTGTFYYNNVIKQKYQDMINDSVWNIGGNGFTGEPYSQPLLTQYSAERGTTTFQNSRATTWIGKVGLMYPSDYGYASTSEECRKDLRAGSVQYSGYSYFFDGFCDTNNWLQWLNSNGWTLSPSTVSASKVFVPSYDTIDVTDAYVSREVRPVIYLKPNVKIVSGDGSKNSYVLE